MKRKILVSSILTIALCFSLIAGATYALFTSQSEVNVAVTSGKVDVAASIVDLVRYSAATVAGTDKTAEMTDENGKDYYYDGPLANFANGGTAEYVDGKLTLDNITPGDKVTFTIKADNNSDVAILYRVKVTCTSGEYLMTGLNVKFGDAVATTGLTSYVSAWTATTVIGEDIPDIPVEIELPITAGNSYQDLTANLVVTLEAVQGNADMDDESALDTTEVAFRVANDAELAAALQVGGYVVLTADINDVDANTAINVPAGVEVTLDLNGHKITATADKTGNQELFLVKGNMTVKNGSLELTAENNQGWNAMATIFDVTAGGVLKLDGVTANVAGTDMNFFVHLNNWGSATLEMTNCDVTTTYAAVRVFNSGYDMNTVTIENSDFHNGRMFWVHNYTSEGKDASTLTLDIYDNNNTSDNANPVRFGFSNPVYYDINGNEIVD